MDIDNLRRVSEESRVRAEQRRREAAAQEAEREAARKRQWEADLPNRVADVEQEIRRSVQHAASEGKRECLLSHEDHFALWKRGLFGGHNLNFEPSWKERVIIDFCSREGLSLHFDYYGKGLHGEWGQNTKEKSGAVSITARW
jgi:hypothetical protein